MQKRDFEPSSGCTERKWVQRGMRKVLLSRVWAKLNLSEKMGAGKGHSSRNKGFGAKLGFLRKVGVRKGLLGRKGGS